MSDPTDPGLDLLRDEYPNWRIQVTWVSSASGTDVRVLHATDGLTVIVAWSVASLSIQIDRAERET